MLTTVIISLVAFGSVLLVAGLSQRRSSAGVDIVQLDPDTVPDRGQIGLAIFLLVLSVVLFVCFAMTKVSGLKVFSAAIVFLVLFAPLMALSVRPWADALKGWATPAPSLRLGLLWFVLLAVVAVYSVGSGESSGRTILVMTLMVLAILSILSSPHVVRNMMAYPVRLALVVFILWLPIEFDQIHGVHLPAGTGGITAGRLLVYELGLALFVAVARLPGLGFNLRLRWRDVCAAMVGLIGFAALAIPIGLSIGFIRWDPETVSLPLWLGRAVFIYFFIALPEELLFRGALQNLLEHHWFGWLRRWGPVVLAAIVFGAAHLNNPPVPNFKYMLLASIAGLFYGWVWQRTRKITASALTHTAVDWIWVTMFR